MTPSSSKIPEKSRATATEGRPASSDPERVRRIIEVLDRTYPGAATALRWETPLELLLATILSAQCTDERVNQVTRVLFATYRDAGELARAPLEDLERIIHSTGFFRAKARSIKGACEHLAALHQGQVPARMEALLGLPGVARKTANVVLGTAFGVRSGIVVDTHVKRLAQRLGLSRQTDPGKIEQDLMRVIPQDHWIEVGQELIMHGRAVCRAKKPLCPSCPLAPDCPSAGLS